MLGNITGNLFDLSLWTVGVDDDSTPCAPVYFCVSEFLKSPPISQLHPACFIDSCQDAIQKRKKSHTHTQKLNEETLQYCEIDLAIYII